MLFVKNENKKLLITKKIGDSFMNQISVHSEIN